MRTSRKVVSLAKFRMSIVMFHTCVVVVLAACSQLQSRATQFVLESFGSQAFGKALDCIKAMRSAAIKVRTSNHFKFFSFSTVNVLCS